jgi:hypothetical protein
MPDGLAVIEKVAANGSDSDGDGSGSTDTVWASYPFMTGDHDHDDNRLFNQHSR